MTYYMEKGVVYGVDKKRLYILTSFKPACKDCSAKHLCLDTKNSKKIIPAMKRKHHYDFKKGDEVLFELSPAQNTMAVLFFYGIPLLSVVVGLLFGKIFTNDETGLLILTTLFVLLGIDLQLIIKKTYNPFKELDVEVQKAPTNGMDWKHISVRNKTTNKTVKKRKKKNSKNKKTKGRKKRTK
jgi:positive regulator of sigma E activity